MLTAAGRYGFLFSQGKFNGGQAGATMRSITKRLVFRLPASTPKVSACLKLHDIGRLLRNDGLLHVLFSFISSTTDVNVIFPTTQAIYEK